MFLRVLLLCLCLMMASVLPASARRVRARQQNTCCVVRAARHHPRCHVHRGKQRHHRCAWLRPGRRPGRLCRCDVQARYDVALMGKGNVKCVAIERNK